MLFVFLFFLVSVRNAVIFLTLVVFFGLVKEWSEKNLTGTPEPNNTTGVDGEGGGSRKQSKSTGNGGGCLFLSSQSCL